MKGIEVDEIPAPKNQMYFILLIYLLFLFIVCFGVFIIALDKNPNNVLVVWFLSDKI